MMEPSNVLLADVISDPNQSSGILCIFHDGASNAANEHQKAIEVQSLYEAKGRDIIVVVLVGKKFSVRYPSSDQWEEYKTRDLTVNDIIQDIDDDEEWGLETPVFVFSSGFSQGLSFGSQCRVPTHLMVSPGRGHSLENYLQAMGQSNCPKGTTDVTEKGQKKVIEWLPTSDEDDTDEDDSLYGQGKEHFKKNKTRPTASACTREDFEPEDGARVFVLPYQAGGCQEEFEGTVGFDDEGLLEEVAAIVDGMSPDLLESYSEHHQNLILTLLYALKTKRTLGSPWAAGLASPATTQAEKTAIKELVQDVCRAKKCPLLNLAKGIEDCNDGIFSKLKSAFTSSSIDFVSGEESAMVVVDSQSQARKALAALQRFCEGSSDKQQKVVIVVDDCDWNWSVEQFIDEANTLIYGSQHEVTEEWK